MFSGLKNQLDKLLGMISTAGTKTFSRYGIHDFCSHPRGKLSGCYTPFLILREATLW
jgi:hypothetical protein